jgi:hypothetical protein
LIGKSVVELMLYEGLLNQEGLDIGDCIIDWVCGRGIEIFYEKFEYFGEILI